MHLCNTWNRGTLKPSRRSGARSSAVTAVKATPLQRSTIHRLLTAAQRDAILITSAVDGGPTAPFSPPSHPLSSALHFLVAACVSLNACIFPPKVYAHSHMEPPSAVQPPPSCSPLSSVQERLDLYGDLGDFHHPIVTISEEAQKLFDLGLLLEYDYNQVDARRSFQAAAQVDPDCAMCHWGVAYSLGPFGNKTAAPPPALPLYPVFSQEELQEAQQAVTAAEATLSSTSYQQAAAARGDGLALKEQAYISAMKRRYSGGTYGPSWEETEQQYSMDMAELARRYPGDADAPALAAEAEMNLSPWDYYDPFTREPNLVSQATEPLIMEALKRAPSHPLASHLYIHLTEAVAGRGPQSAGRAEASADTLSTSHPSMGHLTHMAAHTYLRVGRWGDALRVSERAVASDRGVARTCIEPYGPQHNVHMLVYAASMGAALSAAEQHALGLRGLPDVAGGELLVPAGTSDWAPAALVRARYAQWDKIAKDEGPGPGLMGVEYQHAVHQYVNLLAAAAEAQRSQDVEGMSEVDQRLVSLQEAVEKVPQDISTRPGQGLGLYSMAWKVQSEVALHTARGRVAAMRGDLQGAEEALRQAVSVEGTDGYMEPPRQYQPTRQCLGWVLMQQGKLEEAEQVYRSDLSEYPANPWSLKGLQQVYASGASAAAASGYDTESERLTELAEGARGEAVAALKDADPGLQLPSSCPVFSQL